MIYWSTEPFPLNCLTALAKSGVSAICMVNTQRPLAGVLARGLTFFGTAARVSARYGYSKGPEKHPATVSAVRSAPPDAM